MKKNTARLALNALMAGLLAAAPMAVQAEEAATPTYKISIALGKTKAFSYKYNAGTVSAGFRGTILLPQAEGQAKVKSREGRSTIYATFEHLQPASRFGPEYMTYVLWAITPAGRATNLGEVLVKPSGKARIDATTSLETFGLIVTAEPHFAVASVSDLVVLENVLTEASKNKVEEVEAHYPLLPRGTYVVNANPADFTAPKLDPKVSPYVYQARNAFRLARAEEADRYAPEAFGRAQACYERLEAEKKGWKRPAILLARQVAQLSEDARVIAATRREEARHAEERRLAEEARAQVEATRIQVEAARAQAEAARAQAEMQARLDKERAGDEALKAKQRAAKDAGHSAKVQIREKLSRQLGKLLQTQDTDRGLIVRMNNLLFPTGKAHLLPPAREKLAKVAGILLAYPGLEIKVEGHTDNTGKPEFNQKLSEMRGATVRNYLIKQGIPPQAISAEGLGHTCPLTSNETPTGRQLNRRVELIVAGDPIGI